MKSHMIKTVCYLHLSTTHTILHSQNSPLEQFSFGLSVYNSHCLKSVDMMTFLELSFTDTSMIKTKTVLSSNKSQGRIWEFSLQVTKDKTTLSMYPHVKCCVEHSVLKLFHELATLKRSQSAMFYYCLWICITNNILSMYWACCFLHKNKVFMV